MSLDNVAPGGGEGNDTPITVVTPASDAPSFTAREAMREVVAFRNKKSESQAAPVEADPPPVEQPQELADEANAAPPDEEVPGETQEAEPAEQPTIEPPRSWTKEAKERWDSLPRETQEYLATREQERDREVRRSQNETAEKLKGLTAKEQAVEQARQQYESALPQIEHLLQQQLQGEFSDVQSMDDVQRLSKEDPFRYLQWTAAQQKIAAVRAEASAAQQRQEKEFASKWEEYSQREDSLLLEKEPELADKAKADKLRSAAQEALDDLGFTPKELNDLWNGKASLSLRDHRIQRLLLSDVKLRGAQKAKAQAAAKPVPPVQRPGAAPARGQANQDVIQNLNQRLERTGDYRDAAKLVAAARAAKRR